MTTERQRKYISTYEPTNTGQLRNHINHDRKRSTSKRLCEQDWSTTLGYDGSLDAMEDYDLNLRIARKYQIGRISEVLVCRRIHPGSYYTCGYDNQYIFQLPVHDKYMSDPDVVWEIGFTKEEYMCGFILKFIFKDMYEGRREFITQKLHDLERYSRDKSKIASKLVECNDVSSEEWRQLIPEFYVWEAEIKHKAALFKQRSKGNFNIGAGRLKR